jgi:paired amphipathic helix protein Sin3a
MDSQRERWQYYTSSYMRTEPTEGVNRSRLQPSLVMRNLPSFSETDSSADFLMRKPYHSHEGLVLRICLNSSKLTYEAESSEYFIYGDASRGDSNNHPDTQREHTTWSREQRTSRFKEKMVMNVPWMKNRSREDVQKKTDECKAWMESSAAAGPDVMDTTE